MDITKAMIWWNDAEEHASERAHLRDDTLVQVRVLTVDDDNSDYAYLSNSIGACFLGWDKAPKMLLATHLLAIYNLMVARDGVDAREAHQEMMKLDAYRDWHTGEGDGEFKDAYWAWEQRKS